MKRTKELQIRAPIATQKNKSISRKMLAISRSAEDEAKKRRYHLLNTI
jgi:hypothetical protein